MKKRVFAADLIRVIAIYLVIAVHAPGGVGNIYASSFSYMIAKSGVPIFVLLSGMLLLNKQESLSDFYKKRFSRIIIPWITWSIVLTLVTLNSQEIQINIFSFLSKLRETFIGIWFLTMIAGLYTLTPTIRKFTNQAKQKDLLYLITIWFLVVSFLPYFRNTLAFPRNTDNSLLRQVIQFSGYYLIGFYIYKFKIYKKVNDLILILCIFAGLYWIAYSAEQAMLLQQDHNVYYTYHNPGIVLISTSEFILLFKYGKKIKKYFSQSWKKLIINASKLSLALYLFHPVVHINLKDLFGSYPLEMDTVLLRYFNAAILFIVTYLILLVLTKIPIIRKLVA